MNTKNITAVLLDIQPVQRHIHLEENNTSPSTKVFNKPLLDHHIEALQAAGIQNQIVISQQLDSKSFRSSGAAFKAGTTFKSFLSEKDLNNDHFIFIPANVYLHFDLDYFIKAHFDRQAGLSRVAPILSSGKVSAAYMNPVLVTRSILSDLFQQVSRLTVDNLKVVLEQASDGQNVPTNLITSALSTPAQQWNLHLKLQQVGLSGLNPVGFPHGENIWAALNARIHPGTFAEGLVIAGDNVVINADVRVKGFVVLGDDVVIDKGAVIENSIIESGTYVGRNLRVENSVVSHNQLHRIDRGVTLKISDDQVLGETNPRMRLFGRKKAGVQPESTNWEVVYAG